MRVPQVRLTRVKELPELPPKPPNHGPSRYHQACEYLEKAELGEWFRVELPEGVNPIAERYALTFCAKRRELSVSMRVIGGELFVARVHPLDRRIAYRKPEKRPSLVPRSLPD